jgi:hypothetical protein
VTVFGLNLRPANGLGVAELMGFLFAGLLMAGTPTPSSMRCLTLERNDEAT